MPISDKRVIASDLDGTLLGPDHRLSARTIDALRAARAAGWTVIAATGRNPTSAMSLLGRHDVIDTLVGSNGSLVHDPIADATIHRFPIDAAHLAFLFTSLDAGFAGLSYCWELADTSAWDFVEITGIGVDKSRALAHVIEPLGFTAADVIAFGDNHNDLQMLSWAGRGVAVANAVDAAKDAADEVIGHHGDDSVAAYIESLL